MKKHRRFLFGDGGGSTTAALDPAIKEILLGVSDRAMAGYDSGAFSRVAGPSQGQQAAFGSGLKDMDAASKLSMNQTVGSQGRLAGLAQTGGVDEGLREAALMQAKMGASGIGKAYGAAGTLGSARQGVQEGAMRASVVNDLNNRAFGNRMAAESQLGQASQLLPAIAAGNASMQAKIGNEDRGVQQQQADAAYQGVQRLAGMLNPNALAKEGTTTTTSGGK